MNYQLRDELQTWQITQIITSDAAIAAQETSCHQLDWDRVPPAANARNNFSPSHLQFALVQLSSPVSNAKLAIKYLSKGLEISRSVVNANLPSP